MGITKKKDYRLDKKLGRPPIDAVFKKIRVTVSLEPFADREWEKLCSRAGIPKGHLASWLSLAPEAEESRKLLVKHARGFIPQPKEK